MDSIFKIITFCAFVAVSSHEIDKGVIVGPQTPLLYLTYPQHEYLKVNRTENVFEASPAYNYYQDPSNQAGVYFVRVLVIVDYYLSPSWSHQDIIKNITDSWNKVDEYFEKLNTPKIKLVISGVIIPTVSDVLSFLEKYSFTTASGHSETRKFYGVPSTLDNMSKWLFNNSLHLEELPYDTFVYMSSLMMERDGVVVDERSNSYFDSYIICVDNDNLRSARKGGLFYNDGQFSLNVAQMIAIQLDVPLDDLSTCGTGHIMDYKLESDSSGTWSECSKKAFKKMIDGSRFNCLKNNIFKKDDNSDDL